MFRRSKKKPKCEYCTGIFPRQIKYKLGRTLIDPWDREEYLFYSESCKKHLPNAIDSIRQEGLLKLMVIETSTNRKIGIKMYLLGKEGPREGIITEDDIISAHINVHIYKEGRIVGSVDEDGNFVLND